MRFRLNHGNGKVHQLLSYRWFYLTWICEGKYAEKVLNLINKNMIRGVNGLDGRNIKMSQYILLY
jgi:hypothetical protein